jgi:hypothetical protein
MSNKRPLVFKLNGVIRDFVKNLNFALEEKDLINYDYADWYLINKYDEHCDKVANNPLFWKNLKPFDDAWYQVNHFFNQALPVIIVTDSYSTDKDEDWLDSWRIQYDKVISSRHHFADNLKDINPLLIVDDIPENIELYHSMGFNGILRRAWYNRDFWTTLPNVGNFFDLKV